MADRFDISKFRTEINKNGVLQNNKFLTVIAVPKGLQSSSYSEQDQPEGYYPDNQDFITIRCETVTIPGQNFFTSEIKRYGYGQFEKTPYLPAFNPIRMVFIVDRKAKIIQFFNDWANLIINHDFEYTEREKQYLQKYRNEYLSPVIRTFVYNEYDELAFVSKIFDCFPITISDNDVSWSSQNDFIRLSVVMQFVHSTKEFYSSEQNQRTPVFEKELPPTVQSRAGYDRFGARRGSFPD